jgi:hypothetical protein
LNIYFTWTEFHIEHFWKNKRFSPWTVSVLKHLRKSEIPSFNGFSNRHHSHHITSAKMLKVVSLISNCTNWIQTDTKLFWEIISVLIPPGITT